MQVLDRFSFEQELCVRARFLERYYKVARSFDETEFKN